MLNAKAKSLCLNHAVEITKQVAAHRADPGLLVQVLEDSYKKLVELAEEVVTTE